MPRTYKRKTSRKYSNSKPQTLPDKFEVGFLAALDGRTKLYDALNSNKQAIVSDMGGEAELGHVKTSLVERFVWLEAMLQTIEHEIATGAIGKTEAIGRWIQGVNALTGLAKVLGVERRVNQPWIDAPSNGQT